MLRTRVALACPAKTCNDNLGVLCRMPSKDENKKISHYQRWLPIQPIHSPSKAYCTCASAATTLSLNKLQVQMTKIPKESADQKDSVWYYHGSCMPKTLLWSKAIRFGGSTWLSKCVRALHFPLLGFETGLERETAWNYWDIFYKDLLQVTFDIRTGNTKDGWKKARYRPTTLLLIWNTGVTRLHMTKIPKESADQKDIVWYYHGSCMPKTLLWSKAIPFGGSTWLSKCVRALYFPLLGFEAGSWKRNCVKLLRTYSTKTYSKLHSISELVIPRTVGKSTV